MGHLWVPLGRLGAHLGPILGRSWLVLGPSWAALASLVALFGHPGAHLGAILGSSWGHLGPSWAILGHLGLSWGILGPSWPNLGPSWPHLGRPGRPVTCKNLSFHYVFEHFCLMGFFAMSFHLGSSWRPLGPLGGHFQLLRTRGDTLHLSALPVPMLRQVYLKWRFRSGRPRKMGPMSPKSVHFAWDVLQKW